MCVPTLVPSCPWKVPVRFAYTKYKLMLADVQRIHRMITWQSNAKDWPDQSAILCDTIWIVSIQHLTCKSDTTHEAKFGINRWHYRMTWLLCSLVLQWLWVEFASCIGSMTSQDALTSQCSSLSSSKSQDCSDFCFRTESQRISDGPCTLCWAFLFSRGLLWFTIRSLPAGSNCTTVPLWRRCDFGAQWFFTK